MPSLKYIVWRLFSKLRRLRIAKLCCTTTLSLQYLQDTSLIPWSRPPGSSRAVWTGNSVCRSLRPCCFGFLLLKLLLLTGVLVESGPYNASSLFWSPVCRVSVVRKTSRHTSRYPWGDPWNSSRRSRHMWRSVVTSRWWLDRLVTKLLHICLDLLEEFHGWDMNCPSDVATCVVFTAQVDNNHILLIPKLKAHQRNPKNAQSCGNNARKPELPMGKAVEPTWDDLLKPKAGMLLRFRCFGAGHSRWVLASPLASSTERADAAPAPHAMAGCAGRAGRAGRTCNSGLLEYWRCNQCMDAWCCSAKSGCIGCIVCIDRAEEEGRKSKRSVSTKLNSLIFDCGHCQALVSTWKSQVCHPSPVPKPRKKLCLRGKIHALRFLALSRYLADLANHWAEISSGPNVLTFWQKTSLTKTNQYQHQCQHHRHHHYQANNQANKQSINQWINQTNQIKSNYEEIKSKPNQSFNQSIDQSIDQSMNKSIHSIKSFKSNQIKIKIMPSAAWRFRGLKFAQKHAVSHYRACFSSSL